MKTEEKALNDDHQKKEALMKEIERLNTDSTYIEEIARKEYGMIKKGEKVFHITLPDSANKGKKDAR